MAFVKNALFACALAAAAACSHNTDKTTTPQPAYDSSGQQAMGTPMPPDQAQPAEPTNANPPGSSLNDLGNSPTTPTPVPNPSNPSTTNPDTTNPSTTNPTAPTDPNAPYATPTKPSNTPGVTTPQQDPTKKPVTTPPPGSTDPNPPAPPSPDTSH